MLLQHCVALNPNLSFTQISKTKPTNPPPYLHADFQLLAQRGAREKPQAPKPTTIITPHLIQAANPQAERRLLIKVHVEAGRVVAQSSHYTDDYKSPV